MERMRTRVHDSHYGAQIVLCIYVWRPGSTAPDHALPFIIQSNTSVQQRRGPNSLTPNMKVDLVLLA